MAGREAWITTSTLARGSSYEQMLEFFGIPPYSAEALDENIARKRRDWHHKTNSGNPLGRAKAKDVVALIQNLSQRLKRGMEADEGGGASADIPDEVFQTLEELWRIVSEYVFADEYDSALQVAREAKKRWGAESADAASVFAWIVATGFNTSSVAHPSLLAEGLHDAEIAAAAQPAEPRNWESRISLLVASSRAQDAIAAIDESAQVLGGGLTARMHVLRVRAALSLSRYDDALTSAVRAVHVAISDSDVVTAVRSELTDMLVAWLTDNLLPIRTAETLNRYVEIVNVAAWCSDGVPEAEDMVRVHRMWAANAGKRVFVGSWKLRSFLAVCTGFISLPIHNYVRSAPAWRVFADGIDVNKKRSTSFSIVAAQYVQKAHNMAIAVALDDI